MRDIVALLRGSYRSADGLDPRPVPGQGAQVQVWVLGSSAGESAAVAGELGLPFAANYHVSPATVLEAVDAYRKAFVPSDGLDRPTWRCRPTWSSGPTTRPPASSPRATACGSAASGAEREPSTSPPPSRRPGTSGATTTGPWSPTGSTPSSSARPKTVAAGLERLQEATGADELVITTITHDHADRVRSYELLAREWLGEELAASARVRRAQ